MKSIREYSGLPKSPVYLVKNLWNVARMVSKLPDCDDNALAKLTGVSESEAKYLRTLLFKVIEFENIYAEVDSNTPEDVYSKKERINLIISQLKELLTPDEFCVVVHTFGLEDFGFHKMSFVEIEEIHHIKSPQHLKVSAIKKLKNSGVLKLLYEEGNG
jgi:hypothetical protein